MDLWKMQSATGTVKWYSKEQASLVWGLGAAAHSQDPGWWWVPFSILKKLFPQKEMCASFPEYKFLPGHWDLY